MPTSDVMIATRRAVLQVDLVDSRAPGSDS